MKRVCNRCKNPIRKTHRWHATHHEFKIFGFVLFRWDTVSHRDCFNPHLNPANRYARLECEQPFDELEHAVTPIQDYSHGKS